MKIDFRDINWGRILAKSISFLSAFTSGSLIGAILGRPAAKGQMLAAGAIIVYYMLIGGLAGLVITVIVLRQRSTKFLWWSAGILPVLFLSSWAALRLTAG
ncbi:hypothetical protein CEQ90_14145 [Lewinellaceae bacterium SD302]|nr:hypothetical protein CEQ90_14145 [Lewinellaceae bacterium SD302]